MSSTVIESETDDDTTKLNSPVEAKSEAKSENEILADEIMVAFKPFECVMRILFRFPLTHRRVKTEEETIYQFLFIRKSVQNYGFLISTGFLLLLLLLTLINLLGTLLNFPGHPQPPDHNMTNETRKMATDALNEFRLQELYLFRRNIGPVLMITTSLVQACVGSVNFYLKREFASTCLTFWTRAAGMLKINMAEGVRKYFSIVLLSYGGILLLIGILNIAQFIPVATGAPGMLGMLLGRVFSPNLYLLSTFFIFRSFCSLVFFYILVSSKIYILLFLFQCKLLKNAFSVWNTRLERVLHSGEPELSKEEKKATRTGFLYLFQDHVCLLDMMDATDRLFASTIETYFGTQLVSVCFEIYYFYRSQAAKNEFPGARRLDGIYVFLYMAQTILILYVVSKSAADVGSSATEGLQIIRRKGLIGKKSEEEIYFMLNMYTSYNGHFDTALSGGKYFVMDNSFLVGITGTIFSYFIILIQFTPSLSYAVLSPAEKVFLSNSRINDLLDNFEGTRQLTDALPVALDFNSTA